MIGESKSAASVERERILEEYGRRGREIPSDIYSPWNPSQLFAVFHRRRAAADLLKRAGLRPEDLGRCMEVGYGTSGWLPDLIGWGVPSSQIHGMELDENRAAIARRLLPQADLRIGDATALPWPNGHFNLVITSTVFTSVLDREVRVMLASEVTRVLSKGGALLWYDFKMNNPSNPNVLKVTARDLRQLFPMLDGELRSVTLAPPIARRVAPRSWLLASILEAIPFLHTHLIAVLKKAL